MPQYLGRFSYTADAKKALVSQPEDRSAAAREVAESLGGKLVGFWYAFGEFDGVFVMEAPDNASAAALGMAIGAGGALSEVETTVLLDMDEAQDAMRKAAAATYRAARFVNRDARPCRPSLAWVLSGSRCERPYPRERIAAARVRRRAVGCPLSHHAGELQTLEVVREVGQCLAAVVGDQQQILVADAAEPSSPSIPGSTAMTSPATSGSSPPSPSRGGSCTSSPTPWPRLK